MKERTALDAKCGPGANEAQGRAQACNLHLPRVHRSVPSLAEVEAILEWAGVRLLSLPKEQLGPRKLKATWPSYALDAVVAYGYNSVRVRPPVPGSAEIDAMDKIFGLVPLVNDTLTRRILQCRSLVSPINMMHVYRWTEIAATCDLDRRTVRRRHASGLSEISHKVPAEILQAIRTCIRACADSS